eukprot:8941710-Karenia_brevis.AAC.1
MMKTLRDPSSVLQARNLYRDTIEFHPYAGIEISTNVDVKFSTMDGGIRRCLTSCRWPFQFTSHPQADNERLVDVSLKDRQKIQSDLPGLCWLLFKIDQ